VLSATSTAQLLHTGWGAKRREEIDLHGQRRAVGLEVLLARAAAGRQCGLVVGRGIEPPHRCVR
jgi:hypothetical protein